MGELISEDRYRDTFSKLVKINRLHRSIFENNVSRLGIHHSQHHFLMYLARGEAIPSQKEIAEDFQISPAAVAVSLKKLEKLGYVKREGIDEDNRVKKILITEKGKLIVEKTVDMFGAVDRNVFRDFSEEELNNFNSYLDRMLANIEETSQGITSFGGNDEKEI